MDKIKHLYIIGNGFDIHHDRKTSYGNFYTWALENYGRDIADLEEKLGGLDEDWWSDFENNLANINAYEISQNIAFENEPDLLDDYVDRQWNVAQIYTEQLFDGVYTDIKMIFEEWIQNGIKKTNPAKLVSLKIKDSFFLTFNYSDTLEEFYGIPAHQILHIHGSIYDKTFIIGHGKTRDEISKENDYTTHPTAKVETDNEEDEYCDYEEEGLQLHEQLALDAAIDGVASQRKPVAEIIKENAKTFNSFSGVTDIHIYGFSFSDIDLPYINKIVQSIDKSKVTWEVSDFRDENKDKIEQYFKCHYITNYKIVALDDLIDRSQLSLF